jgi:hypothetical protein
VGEWHKNLKEHKMNIEDELYLFRFMLGMVKDKKAVDK